jgi:hypothetical protein
MFLPSNRSNDGSESMKVIILHHKRMLLEERNDVTLQIL